MTKTTLTRDDIIAMYPDAAVSERLLVAAVADVALRLVLYVMRNANLFAKHRLTFKGGTAIRIHYCGACGRFSYDLDFSIEGDETAVIAAQEDIRRAVADLPVANICVTLLPASRDLVITSDLLPGSSHTSKIDIIPGQLWHPATQMPPLPHPLDAFGLFDPHFTVPVLHYEQNMVEKCGRWQRNSVTRDLVDLAQLAPAVFESGRADALGDLYWLTRYHNYHNPDTRKKWASGTLSETLLGRTGHNVSIKHFLPQAALSDSETRDLVTQCMSAVNPLFQAIDTRYHLSDMQPFLNSDDPSCVDEARARISEIVGKAPSAFTGIVYNWPEPDGLSIQPHLTTR